MSAQATRSRTIARPSSVARSRVTPYLFVFMLEKMPAFSGPGSPPWKGETVRPVSIRFDDSTRTTVAPKSAR